MTRFLDKHAGTILLALFAATIMGLIIWSTSYYLARYECEEAHHGNYIVGTCYTPGGTK